MAFDAHTTRRALFAAVPALAIAAPAVTAHPLPLNESLALAQVESTAIRAEAARLEAAHASDEAWEAWEARETAFLDWAESLPSTAENAPIKAEAIRMIYSDVEIEEFLSDHPTRDARLALQVIKALL